MLHYELDVRVHGVTQTYTDDPGAFRPANQPGQPVMADRAVHAGHQGTHTLLLGQHAPAFHDAPALAQADFSSDFSGLHLPSHLKKAVITHRGGLTPDYAYLQEALDKARG